MNNLVETTQGTQLPMEKQIEKKKAEITTVLQETIFSQLALDLNDKSELATKKKQSIAMFISKLVTTKDTAGRPAIMTCSVDSIRECALTFCNSEIDLYRQHGYLIPYNNNLQFIISRYGYVSMAKAVDPTIEDYYGDIAWKGDVFEFSKTMGKTQIVKHIQKLENITGNISDIVAIYGCEVHKDGTHIAEVMTMKDIYNALATAHKSLTDTHRKNPKEMLVKFAIRKLARHRLQNAISQNKYVRFEDDYEEENVAKELPSMELTIDETQDFSEPTETIEVFVGGESVGEIEVPSEEWTEEEIDEVMQEEVEQDENVKTIPYYQWINDYKSKGWEQVQGTYDRVTKTVQIRKVQ